MQPFRHSRRWFIVIAPHRPALVQASASWLPTPASATGEAPHLHILMIPPRSHLHPHHRIARPLSCPHTPDTLSCSIANPVSSIALALPPAFALPPVFPPPPAVLVPILIEYSPEHICHHHYYYRLEGRHSSSVDHCYFSQRL
jgi:hypothetical protein